MDAIVADNLTKTYPGKTALKNFNLSISPNTIHGFLGPNGAGKSTTMNILSGLIKQTEGKAYIMGKETLENSFFVRRNLGFLPEIPPLYGDMTVKDFLLFRARLYFTSKPKAKGQVDKALEKMNLKEVERRLIDHLSKGFKQRVGMASALIFDPPVLILDEPAVGLDPKSIVEIRKLISDLREGHTVMFSSHHLGEVEQLCDEITVIRDGRLVLSDSYGRVKKRFAQKKPFEILVKGEDQVLAKALDGYGDYRIVRQEDQKKTIVISPSQEEELAPRLCRRLVENGVDIFEMKRGETDLEEIFIDLMEKQ
ncbi:MAG: ABC transporter ATP-binding protein [Bacteriovoracales bacterium]|nr:ABC transporter ATP-binding protein [Bacteriovoracales bacterium]